MSFSLKTLRAVHPSRPHPCKVRVPRAPRVVSTLVRTCRTYTHQCFLEVEEGGAVMSTGLRASGRVWAEKRWDAKRSYYCCIGSNGLESLKGPLLWHWRVPNFMLHDTYFVPMSILYSSRRHKNSTSKSHLVCVKTAQIW